MYRWLETEQWVPLPAMPAFQNVSEVRLMAGASADPVVRDNAVLRRSLNPQPRADFLFYS